MFNIYRILFLALKKFEWPKPLLVRFPTPNRKIPLGKFSTLLPLNTIWKTLVKGPSLLKFVCLFQVKFSFSIDYYELQSEAALKLYETYVLHFILI